MVFIVGTGHSGSTLLSMILGAHSRMMGLSEIGWFDRWARENDRCSCGEALGSCPVWSGVVARIAARREIRVAQFAEKFPTDLDATFDRTRPAQRVARLAWIGMLRGAPTWLARLVGRVGPFEEAMRRSRNAVELYDTVCQVTGRSIIVDSSKSAVRMLGVHLQRPASVRAIYLTRDGRGVTNSLMKHNGYEAIHAAERWFHGNRTVRIMMGRVTRRQRIHVRYEDLCQDFETTVARLCRFVGVNYEAEMPRWRHAPHHLIAGNGMRFGRGERVFEDAKWRTEMSVEAREIFDRIGGPLNRRLLGKRFRP